MRTLILTTVCFALPVFATAADIPKAGWLLVSKNTSGAVANAPSMGVEMSANGKRISYSTVASNLGPGTFNGFEQVVAFERSGAMLGVVSKNTAGGLANLDCALPALSANGRYVAFQTRSSLQVDGLVGGTTHVFRRDTVTGEIVLTSVTSTGVPIPEGAEIHDFSNDGRFVVFSSYSTTVVPGVDTQAHRLYVRDITKGKTILISENQAGVPLSDASYNGRITSDNRMVIFESPANELPGAPHLSVYVRDLKKNTITLLSRNKNGEPANGMTELLAISPNGRFVVMTTKATNLLPNLAEGGVIVLDRKKGKMKSIDVAEPNLAITQVPGPAVIGNDGSRLFINVSYDGGVSFGKKSDLIEIDLATKQRWIRISLEGVEPMGNPFGLAGSANAEWVAVITDENMTDSAGVVDSNNQSDTYVMRAH